jgi:hypothetical protein
MLFAQTKLIRREQRAMPDYAEFWLPLGRNTLPLLHLWTFILALHLANISAIHPKKFPG